MSAIDTHITSRFNPRHGTQILGGSLAQSLQIYRALKEFVVEGGGPMGGDRAAIERLTKQHVIYENGSQVSILAASSKSVQGPHDPSLKLDEVDEIDDELRQQAMGMAMERRGSITSVLMTSTWHKVAGPMAELMARGRAGAFPVDSYCVFEVLERCPDELSGPHLDLCPSCPLVRWCHSDLGTHPSGIPKAKRSRGHYKIRDLIQKVHAVSPRVFGSDYLCLEPVAAGVWFTTFDPTLHVKLDAEYDPRLPFHLSVDSGVHTGAVWFQLRPRRDGRGTHVNVFADYFAEGVAAESNAVAIVRQSESQCGVGLGRHRVSTDPSGNARTAIGPTVRGEYLRAGLQGRNGLESWGAGKKSVGLNLVEALLLSADGTVSLAIHPRCRKLIQAFQLYARAKRANQWMDYPLDPQEPHFSEDMIDPLCGALKLEFPEGRTPPPNLRTIHGGAV